MDGLLIMAKSKATTELTSLDALQTKTFTARVNVDGETALFPCRELSYVEFYELERGVARPKPADFGAEFGAPNGARWVDESNASYRAAKDAADREVVIRRIAAMLHYPDLSDAEKLDKVRKLAAGWIHGLTELLRKTHFAKEARIEAESRSFPGLRQSDGADTEGDAVDVELLESSAAG
jgi:hypothetical protein